MFKTRHEVDSLQIFFQRGIGISHLQFILKVRNGSQSSYDDVCFQFIREIDKKIMKSYDFDLWKIFCHDFNHIDTLLQSKHRFFASDSATATMISSNILQARVMMSKCPLVIGSKVPGYIARFISVFILLPISHKDCFQCPRYRTTFQG